MVHSQMYHRMAERIFQNLLCLWAAALEQTVCENAGGHAVEFAKWVLLASHGRGFRRSRIPPFPLGERNALLMALLSKVLLRYF